MKHISFLALCWTLGLHHAPVFGSGKSDDNPMNIINEVEVYSAEQNNLQEISAILTLVPLVKKQKIFRDVSVEEIKTNLLVSFKSFFMTHYSSPSNQSPHFTYNIFWEENTKARDLLLKNIHKVKPILIALCKELLKYNTSIYDKYLNDDYYNYYYNPYYNYDPGLDYDSFWTGAQECDQNLSIVPSEKTAHSTIISLLKKQDAFQDFDRAGIERSFTICFIVLYTSYCSELSNHQPHFYYNIFWNENRENEEQNIYSISLNTSAISLNTSAPSLEQLDPQDEASQPPLEVPDPVTGLNAWIEKCVSGKI